MELVGNEKKIQTLFRELKLEDERVAPGFNKVWSRAQVTTPGSPYAFKISFALATALFVITLCSLALWSRNWQRGQQPNPSLAGGSTRPDLTPVPVPPRATPEPKQLGVAEQPNRVQSNRRRLAARRQAELNARNAAISEAVAISSWQSPTATLMESPADDVLTSLPQLSQSAAELKSFLPNTPQ